jgi:cytochrome P450
MNTLLNFQIVCRACIGERFALIEVKVAMVKLLQHFHIEADETTRYCTLKRHSHERVFEIILSK